MSTSTPPGVATERSKPRPSKIDNWIAAKAAADAAKPAPCMTTDNPPIQLAAINADGSGYLVQTNSVSTQDMLALRDWITANFAPLP